MDNIRKNTLALSLVLLMLQCTFVACDGIRLTKYHYNDNTGHKHVEPTEKAFIAEVKDPVACAKLCHTNGVCKSFSYQAETGKCSGCRTLHCDAIDTETLEDSAISMFFSTAKEPTAPSSVRLVDGKPGYAGRLEILQNGQWGTVCSDSFGTKEAVVACKMLNLTWKYARTYPSVPQGKFPILLGDVSCSGSENSVFECPHRAWGEADCKHDKSVGISCAQFMSFSVADTDYSRKGRLQISEIGKSQWYSMCVNGFDKNAAIVACDMVGYRTSNPRYGVVVDDDDGAFSFDFINCTGSEPYLLSCQFGLSGNSCKNNEVITLECL